MITPRRTRLIRSGGLRSFQASIAERTRTRDPWRARRTAVLVPTRAAAEQLRRTLEALAFVGERSPSVLAPPEILTRDDWYAALAERTAPPSARLSPVERYVCMLAAAREAVRDGAAPPFDLRPGLIPAILSFYDDLIRHRRDVDGFERLVVADLEPSAGIDRGARRLLRQTRFLAAAFRAFQRRLDAAGRLDEHGVRRRVLDEGLAKPLVHVVVAVADHAADPDGLWPADFDLLARLPALERIDVAATDAVLAAGFHERLVDLLPGIEEERFEDADARAPVLIAPAGADGPCFTWRDREDELLAVVRRIKTHAALPGPGGSGAAAADETGGATSDGAAEGAPDRAAAAGALDETAVVFQRPLPYLYLARRSFAQAGVPFEARDALPLAAEPYAAALDLVVEFVTSDCSRAAVVGLLRSPHFAFTHAGRPLRARETDALDRALHEARYAGGREELARLADAWTGAGKDGSRRSDAGQAGARPRGPQADPAAAATVAAALAAALGRIEDPGPPSAQIDLVASFLRRHPPCGPAPPADPQRESRARAAVLERLAALSRAHRAFDDTPAGFAETAASVRRWIETRTFAPSAGAAGVQLLDARAVRYGRFRDVHVVGLVDGEWPERPARSILYPASILGSLGWPRERDRLRAERGRFVDLVRLADERTALSTFSLEDDAVVSPSALLDQAADAGLETAREPAAREPCVTAEEALVRGSVAPGDLSEPAASWLALRRRRPDREERRPGMAGRSRAVTYAVSALEQYLDCPFRYFAARELALEEEPADEPVLTPRDRGRLLHRLLETFFSRWQADGHRTITLANVDLALRRFRALVDEAAAGLPPVDRPVVRAWLLGSAAAPGLAEQLFLSEVGEPVDVEERLVELRVRDAFRLDGGQGGERANGPDGSDGGRTVEVRGTADRVDLLSDGTFRIFDYKTNRAPPRDRALQLPVYARCAERELAGRRGRVWRAGAAAYVAFGGPRLHAPLAKSGRELDRALAEGAARAVDALERIGRGEYPARPAERRLCAHCSYPTVCRKDYVAE